MNLLSLFENGALRIIYQMAFLRKIFKIYLFRFVLFI